MMKIWWQIFNYLFWTMQIAVSNFELQTKLPKLEAVLKQNIEFIVYSGREISTYFFLAAWISI